MERKKVVSVNQSNVSLLSFDLMWVCMVCYFSKIGVVVSLCGMRLMLGVVHVVGRTSVLDTWIVWSVLGV